jgi:hypothetical protein
VSVVEGAELLAEGGIAHHQGGCVAFSGSFCERGGHGEQHAQRQHHGQELLQACHVEIPPLIFLLFFTGSSPMRHRMLQVISLYQACIGIATKNPAYFAGFFCRFMMFSSLYSRVWPKEFANDFR